MLHLPQTLLGGGLFGAGFKEEDLRVIHSEAAKYRSKMVDALIECGATKSADEIMRDIKDADFWLEPEEAIEYGLADGIMTQEDLRRWF
jgi:ATP-dependent protease ClpP protease subunit